MKQVDATGHITNMVYDNSGVGIGRTPLEKQFEDEMIQTYREAAKHKYRAIYFMEMIGKYGGRDTAKRLLKDDQVQSGLHRLDELDLLRYSVENLVLNPKYDELFLTSEKDAARARLAALHFNPGDWSDVVSASVPE